MRYFLKLSYNGAQFHGWQSQPNAVSVQSSIENALEIICRRKISITGAGRTDTGVNARVMYAHFDCEEEIKDPNRFLLSLNSLVGRNISIEKILSVHDEAHARFDATSRTYKYFITFSKNPFLHNLSWRSPSPLEVNKMNEAASFLLINQDFTSFAKLHSDVKTNICNVSHAHWSFISDDQESLDFIGFLNHGLVFTITADRFLRNMVRAIVGTLVEVGRGKITPEDFNNIIIQKNRNAAGTSMPPEALFLWNITYPFALFE